MKPLHFITSNRTKLEHARYLALRHGIQVRGKRYYGIAYSEPRSSNRTDLLKKSYEDALARWTRTSGGRDGFFFIEDTSVIVHALSENEEVPGVDVKYWMQSTSFPMLDSLLKPSGNRAVTVRSDVILHMPKAFADAHNLDPVQQFTGKTTGRIVEREIPIETNLLYPWLDGKTFNKWFIPDGQSLPLSCLSIEEADRYDIRKDSIGAMYNFLLENRALEFEVSSRQPRTIGFLPGLFPPILAICGLPCAGKTTLGKHLSLKHGYFHIEASDFMRKAFYERHGLDSTLSIERFAEEALKATPDIVASQIIEEVTKSHVERIIITGFRSPGELVSFRKQYFGPLQFECWYISSNQEVRFDRSIKRARTDAAESFAAFKKRDAVQNRMGLDKIRKDAKLKTIENVNTIRDFIKKCEREFDIGTFQPVTLIEQPPEERPTSLEEAILIGMLLATRQGKNDLSTTQIAHFLNELFKSHSQTSKNNVSRYFNFKYSPYYKLSKIDGVNRYELSATGYSKAIGLLRTKVTPHQ
ncbi:MAG TPA: non-canonical purine NTP pyrophosphatase [Verrucomicrobiae bacterium]